MSHVVILLQSAFAAVIILTTRPAMTERMYLSDS
jgi:hypothetical protein